MPRLVSVGAVARLLMVLGLLGASAQAADTRIINRDGPGEGLNNDTPVQPVGGNRGTTLGAQRRIALQYAADILGSRIASTVSIRIDSNFDALACERDSASLGQASPAQFTTDFSSAAVADTFYPLALANAIAGRRVAAGSDDIEATFNASLDAGDSGCLQGARWYYGLDGRTPADRIGFLSTAVHELIHGLGFVSLVALTPGGQSDVGQFPRAADGRRLPDIYSRFIKDLSLAGQPRWPDLTDAQRADSITNGPDLVFADSVTANGAAQLLVSGFNQGFVRLYAPARIAVGSSVSHWDTSLFPDQIMEPIFTGGDNVLEGIGMSSCVLQAIGWQLINGTRCPDVDSTALANGRSAPAPDPGAIQADTFASGGEAQDDDGGGGGCTVASGASFDPLWVLLLVGAAGVLMRRRRGACR